MNTRLIRSALPIVIIVGAIVIMMALVMSKKAPEKKQEQEKAFLVDVIPVEMRNLDYVVESQGTVLPKVQTVLSAQVSGKVVKVAEAFIEGGMFHKGDVLVQLEQADYMTDLKAAEAELARATALLEEEEARGKVAEEDWRTVKNARPTALGLRKPQLAQEKANVRAAEANLERAKRNLERSTIRAPYDGLVKSKNADIGQFIGTGSQLGVIYGTDVAEIRMPLSDSDLAYLELPEQQDGGQKPKVDLAAKVAGKEYHWQGKLARSEGVVDQSSRVIYAVAEVTDPYARHTSAQHMPLKFGRFVQTRIAGVHADNMVVVPRHVLRVDGTVLLVDDERKLNIREVQVQRTDENSAYISAGLAAGELVATSAVPHPVEGMPVRLQGEKDRHMQADEAEQQTEIARSGDH
ncbi:efflux RND transporter periplasmic adaptor subunit [Neptunicella sp. SCSIO 80796]|uniref:efflux RND transporter periplasmic adaptor subunit n=1 Tax=Neptunicella plasticusilytica TaxID=3117012 RepID=UPI003A4E1631